MEASIRSIIVVRYASSDLRLSNRLTKSPADGEQAVSHLSYVAYFSQNVARGRCVSIVFRLVKNDGSQC